MWFVFATCFLFLAILIIVLALRRARRMSSLTRNGIFGPKPHFFYGNAEEILGKPLIEVQEKWIRRYGKVCGYYLGPQPIVIVADPKLVKKIQIRDFKNFINKSTEHHQFDSSPYLGNTIVVMRDQLWEATRKALVSVFKPSRFRAIDVLMEESIDDFLRQVEQSSSAGEFDFLVLAKKLTLSVLMKTSFGMDSELLIKSLKDLEQYSKPKLSKFINNLHIHLPVLYPLRKFYEEALNWLDLTPIRTLRNLTKVYLDERRQHAKNCPDDLFQAMINSGLSDNEVIANCLLFYVGGYETTSNALSYVVHNLVNHPDVQQRARQEVVSLLEKSERLDYNTVEGLKYLDRVIKESLRQYPPLIRASTRMCKNDWSYEGMVIPKGAMIQVATHYLHNNPDIWPEPDMFAPDRFEEMSEDQRSSWQPFGAGNRNCLGMRFAMLQIKMTVAKLLIDYKLVPGTNTERGRLSTQCRTFSLCPNRGVIVKAVKL